MVLTVRITEGKEFHSVGAATEKDLDPVLVFTYGIKSCLVTVERSCLELIAGSKILLRYVKEASYSNQVYYLLMQQQSS